MPGSQDPVFIDQQAGKFTFAWGARRTYETSTNYRGVLGVERFLDELIARPVHQLTTIEPFVKIATSGSSAVWIDGVGLCKCTGRNTHGELGNNSTTDVSTLHAGSQGGALASVVTDVSAGGDDGIFGLSGGTMFAIRAGGVNAWGHNADGQMGMGDTTQRILATVVWNPAGHSGVLAVRVAAGHRHAAVLDANGVVWTAGNNDDGQLARGTIGVASTTWAAIAAPSGGRTYTDIACSNNCTLLLLSDGTVMAAGDGVEHQLGPSVYAASSHHTATPTVVDSLTNVAEIASAGETSWFRTNDGRLYMYGNAQTGIVGPNGTDYYFNTNSALVEVIIDWVNRETGLPYTPASPITVTVAKLAYSSGRIPKPSLAERNGFGVIGSDGKVYTWGTGSEAQHGDGAAPFPTALEVFRSVNGLTGVATDKAFTWGAQQFYVGGADGTLTRLHFTPGPLSDSKMLRQLAADPADPTNWQNVGFDDSAWTTPVQITPDPIHPVTNADNHGIPVWERNPESGTNLNVLVRENIFVPAETDAFGTPGVLVRAAPFGTTGPIGYLEFPPSRNLGTYTLWLNGSLSNDADSTFWANLNANAVNLVAWRQPNTRTLGSGTGGDTTVWVDWDRVVVYISAIATVAPTVRSRSLVMVIG